MMHTYTEPTPTEIRDQKIYLPWGLTDAEYELVCQKARPLTQLYRNGFVCGDVE